jgi:hypothetical protein
MRFRTAQWDLVFKSGDTGSLQHDRALAELCGLEWYPLYTFARYKGFSEDDAQDLTQSFFLRLLEKRAPKQAEPHKGRFRSCAKEKRPISSSTQVTLIKRNRNDGIHQARFY